MSYILAGVIVAALLLWGAGGRRWLRQSGWRIASGAFAVGVLAAAAYMVMRGGWLEALLLAAIGGLLALSSRWPRSPTAVRAPESGMSLEQARAMLGVGPQAGAAEIQAAYARLMRRAHPDQGGTSGLATQLNIARDRLLKR
jgi:hypothetical protein